MAFQAFVDRITAETILLLKAPILVPEMWWIITPLLIITLLMTFYFGKYIREQLGWNTAVTNSIVLFFVGLDLLRTIYHYSSPASWVQFTWHPIKTAIIIGIMLEGLLLSYTAFEHKIPKQIMFFIASPLPVNLQAYVLTAVVYMQIVPTLYTLYAAIVLFVILYVILRGMQELEHLQRGYHGGETDKKKTKN